MIFTPQFIGMALGNICMYLIYTLKIPFFEKYRAGNVEYKIIILESLALGGESSLMENLRNGITKNWLNQHVYRNIYFYC